MVPSTLVAATVEWTTRFGLDLVKHNPRAQYQRGGATSTTTSSRCCTDSVIQRPADFTPRRRIESVERRIAIVDPNLERVEAVRAEEGRRYQKLRVRLAQGERRVDCGKGVARGR
jgi:hypothetical protein